MNGPQDNILPAPGLALGGGLPQQGQVNQEQMNQDADQIANRLQDIPIPFGDAFQPQDYFRDLRNANGWIPMQPPALPLPYPPPYWPRHFHNNVPFQQNYQPAQERHYPQAAAMPYVQPFPDMQIAQPAAPQAPAQPVVPFRATPPPHPVQQQQRQNLPQVALPQPAPAAPAAQQAPRPRPQPVVHEPPNNVVREAREIAQQAQQLADNADQIVQHIRRVERDLRPPVPPHRPPPPRFQAARRAGNNEVRNVARPQNNARNAARRVHDDDDAVDRILRGLRNAEVEMEVEIEAPRRNFPRRRDRLRRRYPDVDLPRLENEIDHVYECRNHCFKTVIMPKIRNHDRLIKEFVRWLYPDVIATKQEDIDRIRGLRGETFDLVRFLEAERLIEATQPFEQELQRRFRVTQHDILMELLAEHAEEEDEEENPRAPSPAEGRDGAETGVQYFHRQFGQFAEKARLSPAPADIPENLEEALNLLARVPNGREPQEVADQFGRRWYNRQCEKIKAIFMADWDGHKRVTLDIRENAVVEEHLQLSYEIITMPADGRKRLWYKAIQRAALRDNVELRHPFGPNMVIPPAGAVAQVPVVLGDVIVLGDSDDEEMASPPILKRRRRSGEGDAPNDPIVLDADMPGPSHRLP